jgi:hemerythrin-like domain-containing protein
VNAVVARSRPQRPPVPTLSPFAALDHTHRSVLDLIGQLDTLVEHLETHGADATARRVAAEIHRFFSENARQHHADEERLVFPGLLAAGDPELAQQVRRLQQDHGWLEEDWLEIAPQLEAVAAGYNWYDLAMLRLALPVFRALYEEHIALEESLVYPAARRRQAALAAGDAARKV